MPTAEASLVAKVSAPPRPALIDPAMRPIYLLIAAGLGAELLVLAMSDFYLGSMALIGLFARRRGFARAAIFIEAVAIPPVVSALAVTGTVMLAAISVPFVDAQLDAADELLGFDFPALLQFYRDSPRLATASRYAYLTFAIQSALLFAIVALLAPPRRLWIMMNAWVFSLLVAVLVFPFAPAAGPYVFHGVAEDVFEQWQQLFPWNTGPAIEALRDGTMRDVAAAARGLVSIPSFHAVTGVVFAWAAWGLNWLRWPLLLVNLALIASTVVTGSHYLIDIVVGIAVAALALCLSSRWVDRAEAPASS
jgi:membrane-associated phospholipid phosphatase